MEIQTKEQIINALEKKYAELIEWLNNHDAQLFERPEASGKWSAGQHADHLVKSTSPLRQGLDMPKIALRTTFGINNRTEKSFNELVKKYKIKLSEGGRAGGRFLPKEIKNEQKSELIEQLKKELEGLKNIMEKWDEKK